METVLRRKLIILDTCIRKDERFKMNNLSFHLQKLEKEENLILKNRRKEIIKIRIEFNEIQNRKATENQ